MYRNCLGFDVILFEMWVNIIVIVDEIDFVFGVLIYVDGVEMGSYVIFFDGSGGIEWFFDGSFLFGNLIVGL